MQRRIVFCGDDFGLNAGVDVGILELAGLNRLSAVSCLAHGPSFAAHGPALRDAGLDVGLHFNLTERFGSTAQPEVLAPGKLLARACAGRLDSAWIERQLRAQLETFERVLGRAPDHIGGYRQVHQLPAVLPALLGALRRHYGNGPRPWLRHTAAGSQHGIPMADCARARLIGALGARGVERAARRENWPINRRMHGIYDMRGGARRYAGLLQRWLDNACDGDLLVCHPAGPGAQDARAAQRQAEFEVWKRPEMAEWLRRNGLRCARLGRY